MAANADEGDIRDDAFAHSINISELLARYGFRRGDGVELANLPANITADARGRRDVSLKSFAFWLATHNRRTTDLEASAASCALVGIDLMRYDRTNAFCDEGAVADDDNHGRFLRIEFLFDDATEFG